MKLSKLAKGDCIGIFSSSSPTTKEALDKMQRYFTDQGYRYKIAPHTLDAISFMAGQPADRVNDLNSLLTDPDVKLVMTATGGGSAIQMLPFLDFDLIKQNPKIICGISDPTSILNAITYRTSVPTFHGPNGYNFGHKTPSRFSEENWWKIVTGNFEMPYVYDLSGRMKILKKGPAVRGRIFGGNLGVMSSLMGTPFFPDLAGKILFIEEVQKEYYKIDTFLTQLRLGGVFDQIVGLIVGECHECKDSSKLNPETFENLLSRNLESYTFPVVYGIPLGHTDDKITIPIGCECELDSQKMLFKLIENPF